MVEVKTEAKELAELFYSELKWFAYSKSSIISRAEITFQNMIELEGVEPGFIRKRIVEYKREHPTQGELRGLLFAKDIFKKTEQKKRIKDRGLIQEGMFYFHPKLQLAPPPPLMDIDIEGRFVQVNNNEPFFLEIVESYTMKDLVDYFYNKVKILKGNYKRDSRGFEYFFSQVIIEKPLNALDLVLFTIDGAVALAHDKDRECPRSAVELLDYANEGHAIYREKFNYSKLMGIDHVTPRK